MNSRSRSKSNSTLSAWVACINSSLSVGLALSCLSGSNACAQDASSGAMGGLRGPQDIINATNNRDSYGNPLPGAQGAYGADSSAPVPSGEAPGTIHPFTGGNSQIPNSSGAYLPPPSNQGAGLTPFQGGPNGYPNASSQPPPSYKHHHKSKHQNQYQQSQNQQGGQYSGVGQYPGAGGQSQPQYGAQNQYGNGQYSGRPDGSIASQNYANGGMTGAPTATPYSPKHYGSNNGNNSMGGAVIGVPDRAGKTAVGVGGKVGKEVLKALF